ncbi:hypothetical protein ASG87_17835 [Frateuria sp. Soil773]|uniref:hypothetical protein n=1 Tax=Frateuria sp. Soil773 TaxID=1736407 RepID=UPI0006F7D500|nr:hypothetical protein [Frateuria sp. Soil773]KRE94463.1 hypothetical protein ASG87_17835 [Frateuria sp. Soil773]
MAASSPLVESLLETTRRLIGALQQEPSAELRLVLAKRIVRQLGDEAYPVFLKILLIVAESEDAAAKQTVADLLATAAQRMDLPSGQLSSWGSSSRDDETAASGSLNRRRLLGPLEYLTVWYCQQTQRPMLEEPLYADALRKLLALFDLNPQLRAFYAGKLAADAGNELEGTYTRDTRDILQRLARGWQTAGSTPEQIVQSALRGQASETPVPSGWIVHRL